MGFGLLLFGYLAAFVMSYSFVPGFIGLAIMMWASIKLSDYEPKFKRCLPVLIPLSIASIYVYGAGLFGKLLNIKLSIFPEAVVGSVKIIEQLLTVAFLSLLMIAIASLAKQTGLDKLAFRAVRNMFILCLGEGAYLIALCLPSGQVANVIANVALIVRALRIILDLMLIFACYRMICQAGDEDMPAKEVRIPILRKMEEVMNRRDKQAFDSGNELSEKRKSKKKNKK